MLIVCHVSMVKIPSIGTNLISRHDQIPIAQTIYLSLLVSSSCRQPASIYSIKTSFHEIILIKNLFSICQITHPKSLIGNPTITNYIQSNFHADFLPFSIIDVYFEKTKSIKYLSPWTLAAIVLTSICAH